VGVCVCACVCVCVHVYIHIYISTHMYICVYSQLIAELQVAACLCRVSGYHRSIRGSQSSSPFYVGFAPRYHESM